MNEKVLGVRDIQDLFGVGRDEASRLIIDVNRNMHDRGYVTLTSKVLNSHLTKAMCIDGETDNDVTPEE